MRPHKQNPAEIPPVKVTGSRIFIDNKGYDLILCYLCPLCNEPLTAMWRLSGGKATPEAVGRALRDSGFGGYRFFESEGGQGFEYDAEKDPRKRHQHPKEESGYSYYRSYGGQTRYEVLWLCYIHQNPVFSLNEFLTRTIGQYGAETTEYISKPSVAIKFIEKMREYGDTFKVVEDKMGHGKPLFLFNLAIWERKTRMAYRTEDKKKTLIEWFGEELMANVTVG